MRFAPLLIALLLALAGAGAGCVMPAGQEVAVSRMGGAVYTGNGVLLEVSADRTKCRVAVRNNALFVERRWVDCRYVHARPLL